MRGGKIVGKPGYGNFFTVNRAVVDSALFHPFAPVASPHISQVSAGAPAGSGLFVVGIPKAGHRPVLHPVADGERLGKSPPICKCPSSVAALRRVDATGQAGCLSHYLCRRSASEFRINRRSEVSRC